MRMIECFYCGDTTREITRDHVRPVSIDSAKRSHDAKDTVSCCRECNTTLSDNFITTVEERSAFLVDKYLVKYRSILNTPRWSEEELNELGPHMRSKVLANVSEKQYVVERLKRLNETAAAMYDSDSVKHLRGMVTVDKKNAYRIICMFMSSDTTIKLFSEEVSERLDVDAKQVIKIIEEKQHYDVATTYKHERGFPLDYPLKAIKRSIKGL